ncbi:protein tesmin/TSO1-like CXC 2 isoform X3 [Tripterygium wilfordii]|uniref:protein tesmin/TSO1-like CXC 2 isoform X3 n=1 Tax=Tripterygium wilfordii TaxID=458696 RepID=UPI0018F7FBB3|nr:protein tesmin/TSO1-like CXC 2 isoform X3 [Tripterygium wilfordii]
MDSPERDRQPVASSVEDSPLTCYLNTLSPLELVKAIPYSQRFTDINFSSPPPVFKSPRLDLQRETSFLKREKIEAGGSVVYGESESRLKPIIVPCSQKEVQSSGSDVNEQTESQLSPMPIPFSQWEDQWHSSAGCVDEYLIDPEELDDSLNSLPAQAARDGPHLSQSCFTGTQEIIPKLEDANHVVAEAGMLKFSWQYEKKFSYSLLNVAESAVDTMSFERDANGFLELNSSKFNCHMKASNSLNLQSRVPQDKQYMAQVSQNVMLQTSDGPLNEWDRNYPQYLESFDSVEACEHGAERSKILGPAEDVDRDQRAIRRHLQFGATMVWNGGATTSSIDNQSNPTKVVVNSMLPARFRNLKDLVPSSQNESIGISSRGKPVSYHNTVTPTSSCPSEFVGSTRNVGDLPVPDFTPSSLSSMARSVSMHSNMFASKNLAGYMSSQEKHLATNEGQNLANYSNINSVTTIAAKTNVHTHMDDDEEETHAVEAATSASLPVADRKRVTGTSESEGCKRCNCKRSKCLKLYCECFAAGVYCVDCCACTECFNKPEYEETVLDARHQIQSRNPLAFAPKIVKSVTDSPANLVEEGNQTTPSSARHKRGCNCKKSKCLKKYCECFQARVGCSDGCRCEGCNNPFGQKTAILLHNAGFTGAERWENPCHQKLDTKETVTADSIKAGRMQCSPNWKELANIIHGTPPVSHQHLGSVTSSSNPDAGNSSNVSPIDLHCRRSYQPSVGYPPWSCSPLSLATELSEGMPPQELGCHIPPYGILKDGDTPEILRVTSTPPKAVKAYSPNKKRISPPQHQPQGSRSSYLPSLRSGRKFKILQSMPSFPPLTPCSKSKDCSDVTGKDHRGGSTSSQ